MVTHFKINHSACHLSSNKPDVDEMSDRKKKRRNNVKMEQSRIKNKGVAPKANISQEERNERCTIRRPLSRIDVLNHAVWSYDLQSDLMFVIYASMNSIIISVDFIHILIRWPCVQFDISIFPLQINSTEFPYHCEMILLNMKRNNNKNLLCTQQLSRNVWTKPFAKELDEKKTIHDWVCRVCVCFFFLGNENWIMDFSAIKIGNSSQ